MERLHVGIYQGHSHSSFFEKRNRSYCNFSPTFKVARHCGYEYNVKRSPSYTDRILFRSGDQLGCRIRPLIYEPIENFTTSDHKPIRGAFMVRLNEPLKFGSAAPLSDAGDTKESKRRSHETVNEGDKTQFRSQPKFVKRDTMHVFVSAIQCFIHPDEFDKLRKVEKAELPNPFVCFVSTPTQAVQTDIGTSKKGLWSKLLPVNKNKKSKDDGSCRNSASEKSRKLPASISRLSDRYPCTTVIEETMRPTWQKENLHFTVRTHLSTGAPIDLTGALLHITLMDAKGPTIVGSFTLNLSELIRTSRSNPKRIVKEPLGHAASPHRGGLGLAGRSATAGKYPGEEGRLLSPTNRAGQESRPRPECRIDLGGEGTIFSPTRARNSGVGPSKSLRSLMERTGPKDGKHSELLEDIQITSLRLDESLIECGLEVGRIKCSLDVWWMEDELPNGVEDT